VVLDLLANGIGVVGPVRHDQSTRQKAPEQSLGCAAVRCLAWRQQEGQRTALAVAQGVDLGGAPASADAERLDLLPPLPPAAQRCAFT